MSCHATNLVLCAHCASTLRLLKTPRRLERETPLTQFLTLSTPTVGRRQQISIDTYGDSGVISMPAGFRCHVVGKTLMYACHCDITEIRFVGKIVIIRTFS